MKEDMSKTVNLTESGSMSHEVHWRKHRPRIMGNVPVDTCFVSGFLLHVAYGSRFAEDLLYTAKGSTSLRFVAYFPASYLLPYALLTLPVYYRAQAEVTLE